MGTYGRHTTQKYRKAGPLFGSEDSWIIPKRTDRKALGPSLPNLDVVVWHSETKKWYDAIRKSDIAQVLTDYQWQSLLDAALLKNAIVSGIGRNGKPLGHRDFQGYQSELRQQLNALGLTPESQKRLKIVFVDPAPQEQAKKNQPSVDYRKAFGDSDS